MSRKTPFLFLLLLILALARGHAEKVDGPGEVEQNSTHILTGTVLNIYSKMTTSDTFETTHYVAEVRVDEVHKGEGMEPGQLVYARYWRHTKRIGNGVPVPGPMGHANPPKEGQKVKVGVGKNADGSFDVYYVGGFMSSGAATAGKQ